MKIAVYPGTFDPLTNGHLDIIRRSAAVFDKVVVGVLENSSKSPLFTACERMDMIRNVIRDIPNAQVASFSGLLVDFMQQFGADVIIKGLRNGSDFEYEFQMALLNKALSPEVETFFMMTDSRYSYISSSMVKDVAKWRGTLDELVPHDIIEILNKKFNTGGQA